MPTHIVLLGDSIFDNARYVPGGPSVIEHLQKMLPRDARATLLAIDGSLTVHVLDQLQQVPPDATHLVISAGGNDAISCSGEILNAQMQTASHHMTHLAAIRQRFAGSYQAAVNKALARQLPLTLCTVYDAIPGLEPEAATGLCLFNDVILREGIRRGVSVLDLRCICTDADDYSTYSPIEPSVAGGRKIAAAIVRAVLEGPVEGRATPVFGV